MRKTFPDAFRRYVYGPAPGRTGALPINLKILQDNDLKAVFFVEPLFSFYFGLAPLQELVGLIQEAGQEIQLHIHPEWLDELDEPLLPPRPKTQFLHSFTLAEQMTLLNLAANRLTEAGAPRPTAFRSGNYSINRDTLKALHNTGFTVDSSINSSYSASYPYPNDTPSRLFHCSKIEGIAEFPVTQFLGGFGKQRHMQIAACSAQELIQALSHAHDLGLPAATLVSHNFELLTANKMKENKILIRRFEKLCHWLGNHSDQFVCGSFDPAGLSDPPPAWQWPRASITATLTRYTEQLAQYLLEKAH